MSAPDIRQAQIDALAVIGEDTRINDFNSAFRALDALMSQAVGREDRGLSAAFKEMNRRVSERHAANIANILKQYGNSYPPGERNSPKQG